MASDEEIVFISSSPEPEEFPTLLGVDAASGIVIEDSQSDCGLANNTLANGHSLSDPQPRASGSGAQRKEPEPEPEPELPEDPVERAVVQVLNVIPNVDPEHLRALVLSFESQNQEVDISTSIISQLLENPDYPKIETNKRKGGEDESGPSKRVKVDYLAEGRVPPKEISYLNYALDHLVRVDFPQIPKDYIKKVFFNCKSLYAPSYFALRADLEAGNKFITKKTTSRSESSRGKRKALAENKDFDMERRWLLEHLEEEAIKKAEEAELAECEKNGTGVECGCCFGDFPFSWMVQCPDAHLFCRDCARRSAEECIGNRKTNLLCMDQSGCKLAFSESEIQRFLSAKTFELWHRIKQEQEIELAQIPGLESCPFCSYAVVIENEQERLFRCENSECGVVSCRECKKEDHLPKTCKEVEQDKVLDARHAVEEAMTKALMRNCPKCDQNFIKEAGCNKMTCPKCRSLSCYVCRKVIKGYDHFDQTPQGAPQRAAGSSSKCPLWDSVETRHADEVKRAAEAAQEEYRRLHPEIEQEDIAVELPVAPPPPAAPGLPGVMIQGFPVGLPQFPFPPVLQQQHQVLLQQAQNLGAVVQQGRYFGGMVEPQRVWEELQANRRNERQRVRQAALQREQEQIRAAEERLRVAAERARAARAIVLAPPPAPAPVPHPRRAARRR
ncbi:TRIAD3 [Ceratobasidium sp. AG-Ba]|nr:TRIAD3 [Ceratobasidium sp. AG-Ba]QRV99567.1 TRIAD3 [Ceratobasidium sp. AG-Ba]QRW14089.1 TRIAD3 [Ceratobasidium sp. AG-Ba]